MSTRITRQAKAMMTRSGSPGSGLAPAVAAVIAAVNRGRAGAGVENPGIGRMNTDRPDVGFARKGQELPAVAAIGAAEETLGRAEINRVGMFRVDRDRVNLGVFRQAGGQPPPA